MERLVKIRAYCDYIEEHLLNVEKSWMILRVACKDMNVISDDFLYRNIDAMVRSHDASKLSDEEFLPYQRNFFPVGLEKDPAGFAAAWEHHKTYNLHHWENWTKIQEIYPNEQACHCVCMILDWMAMGMEFNTTAEQYYEKNRHKIELPEWAGKFISEIFERLR